MVELTFLDGMTDFNSDQQTCNCLPSCTSINYDIELSSAKFDSAKWLHAFDTPDIRAYNIVE